MSSITQFPAELREACPGLQYVSCIMYTIHGAQSSLGCHTCNIHDINAYISFNEKGSAQYMGKVDSWGERKTDVKTRDAMYAAVRDNKLVRDFVGKHMESYMIANVTAIRTFILASDNLDYGAYSSEHYIFRTSTFVEWLVKEAGYGCTASHIGCNANYSDPAPHHDQVWILTHPDRLKWMFPGTAFRANLTEDKIGKPEFLFDFPKRTNGVSTYKGTHSWFQSGRTDFPFANYILPKIMRVFKRQKKERNFWKDFGSKDIKQVSKAA